MGASLTATLLGLGFVLTFVSRVLPTKQSSRKGKRRSDPGVTAGATVRDLGGGRLGVGQITVGPAVLGYGSGGTIVYEGTCGGRPVAVKRVMRAYVDLAHRELGSLVKSDDHPNIVRCYALEEDREFLYLALERCRESLAEYVERREERGIPQARQLCEDMARGLAALHSRGIVHFDLKPYNVLLTDQTRAKLSDLGLAKQVRLGQLSFETGLAHGQGSTGWQAPELLSHRIAPPEGAAEEKISTSGGGNGGAAPSESDLERVLQPSTAPCSTSSGGRSSGVPSGSLVRVRLTRSVDVFALGCLMHHVITGGGHPFGAPIDRDANILKSRVDLSALDALPEARHLVAACVQVDPSRRPSAAALAAHPFFWDDQRRVSFLVDLSNRMELEDRGRHLAFSTYKQTNEISTGQARAMKFKHASLPSINISNKPAPSSKHTASSPAHPHSRGRNAPANL